MTYGWLCQTFRHSGLDFAWLDQYGAIFIDEIGTKSKDLELILLTIKFLAIYRNQKQRSLQVIVMAAHIDLSSIDPFMKTTFNNHDSYIDNSIHSFKKGPLRPIRQFFEKESVAHKQLAQIMKEVSWYQSNKLDPGGVFVFLWNLSLLEPFRKLLEDNLQKSVRIYSLHRGTCLFDRMRYMADKNNKVVLATNDLDPGVTIQGIQYVVNLAINETRVYDNGTGSTVREQILSSWEDIMSRGFRAEPMD